MKKTFTLIILLILALPIAGYLLLKKGLPPHSGEFKVPGLTAKVEDLSDFDHKFGWRKKRNFFDGRYSREYVTS